MIRAATLLLTACATMLTPGGSVLADDNMRCGTRLVSVGDAKDKVRTLCGEPTDIAFVGVIGRRSYPTSPGTGPYDYSWIGPAWIERPVEVWTYNLGPSKLLRKLRFIGEELVEIRTDGYGY